MVTTTTNPDSDDFESEGTVVFDVICLFHFDLFCLFNIGESNSKTTIHDCPGAAATYVVGTTTTKGATKGKGKSAALAKPTKKKSTKAKHVDSDSDTSDRNRKRSRGLFSFEEENSSDLEDYNEDSLPLPKISKTSSLDSEIERENDVFDMSFGTTQGPISPPPGWEVVDKLVYSSTSGKWFSIEAPRAKFKLPDRLAG
jgi:hypothetical protein